MEKVYTGKLIHQFDSEEEMENFFHKMSVTPEQMYLFDNIGPGDIVYCKMPLPEEMLCQIKERHQKRPYVVLSKEEDYFNAFYCTHKRFKHSYRVVLSDKVYDLWKSGYVYTEQVFQVPISCLEKRLDTLKPEALHEMERMLTVQRANGQNVGSFGIPIELCKGDLIRKKNAYYYVISTDHDVIYAYRVSQIQQDERKQISIPDRKLYINIMEKAVLNQKDGYQFFYHCGTEIENEISLRLKIRKGDKRQKRFHHPEKSYQLVYPIGQRFFDKKSKISYIYLFSIGSADYCAYYRYHQIFGMTVCDIRKIVRERCIKKGLASDKVITNAIYDLIAYRPHYKWLEKAFLSEA